MTYVRLDEQKFGGHAPPLLAIRHAACVYQHVAVFIVRSQQAALELKPQGLFVAHPASPQDGGETTDKRFWKYLDEGLQRECNRLGVRMCLAWEDPRQDFCDLRVWFAPLRRRGLSA